MISSLAAWAMFQVLHSHVFYRMFLSSEEVALDTEAVRFDANDGGRGGKEVETSLVKWRMTIRAPCYHHMQQLSASSLKGLSPLSRGLLLPLGILEAQVGGMQTKPKGSKKSALPTASVPHASHVMSE